MQTLLRTGLALAVGAGLGAGAEAWRRRRRQEREQEHPGSEPGLLQRLPVLPVPALSAASVPGPPGAPGELALAKYGLPGLAQLKSRASYVLSYDPRTRGALWVLEQLRPERLRGDGDRRACDFREDDSVHAYHRATNADYRGSGFDRGHLAAAANHRWSQSALDDTFYLSNVAPQVAPRAREEPRSSVPWLGPARQRPTVGPCQLWHGPRGFRINFGGLPPQTQLTTGPAHEDRRLKAAEMDRYPPISRFFLFFGPLLVGNVWGFTPCSCAPGINHSWPCLGP